MHLADMVDASRQKLMINSRFSLVLLGLVNLEGAWKGGGPGVSAAGRGGRKRGCGVYCSHHHSLSMPDAMHVVSVESVMQHQRQFYIYVWRILWGCVVFMYACYQLSLLHSMLRSNSSKCGNWFHSTLL